MPKSVLSAEQKGRVVAHHARGYTQREIAKIFFVSRRTINRVLQAAGPISPRPVVTEEDLKILSLVQARGHTLTTLKKELSNRTRKGYARERQTPLQDTYRGV